MRLRFILEDYGDIWRRSIGRSDASYAQHIICIRESFIWRRSHEAMYLRIAYARLRGCYRGGAAKQEGGFSCKIQGPVRCRNSSQSTSHQCRLPELFFIEPAGIGHSMYETHIIIAQMWKTFVSDIGVIIVLGAVVSYRSIIDILTS